MKQKTAMQDLIETLEEFARVLNTNQHIDTLVKRGVNKALTEAKDRLEKEKEQIIDAFIEGIDELGTIYSAEDYYNSKYKQD